MASPSPPSPSPKSSSRVLKLKILLCIDTAFLFLELFVGAAVGSLALIADAFHMVSSCRKREGGAFRP